MDLLFRNVELKDKDTLTDLFRQYPSRSCDRSFANIYLWSRHYHVTMTEIEGAYVFRSLEEDGMNPSFAYPLGSPENCKKAIERLMEWCEEKGLPFTMYAVTSEQFEELDKMFPGKFEIEYNRDVADYVYDQEKLATLGGRKYHAKRNYINRFIEIYPDWSYETITDDNVEECFQMALAWRRQNGCEGDESKRAEMCVALNALRLLRELRLVGGLIRVNGNVVAFTVGERQAGDTLVVHIEKAYADVAGAYPLINQQFVIHEGAGCPYINREDDTGAEGLRIAKKSYHPVFMVEKGFVTIKHTQGEEQL